VTPPWDPCLVEGCRNLRPGYNCTASCRPPYVGTPGHGGCIANNTDPFRGLSWWTAPPSCTCPPPSEIPVGYTKVGEKWRCAEKYAGTPLVECLTGKECSGRTSFTGCSLVVPCAPPEPSYLTNASHCQAMPDGKQCNASCVDTFCITGGVVVFECPANNTDITRRPSVVSGQCQVACEVCSLEDFIDTDSRPSLAGGVVRFGPVHRAGDMAVPDLEGYRIFFADACGNQIGDLVHFEPIGSRRFDCCLGDAYEVKLYNLTVPSNAAQMVVALRGTSSSAIRDFPSGVAVPFNDVAVNMSASIPRSQVSAARHAAITSRGIRWSLLLASVAKMLHS